MRPNPHPAATAFSVWLSRLSGHHPLVRFSDRVEAIGLLVVIAAALFALSPADSVRTSVQEQFSQSFAAQRAERRPVEAIVTGDSRVTAQVYDNPYLTPIRWQVDGIAHTDEVRTAKMTAGEHLTIWVDAAGNRRAAPMTDRDAAVQAVIAAAAVWFTLAGSALGGWAVLRMRLDRRRHADWDRDLRRLTDNGGRTNNTA
ncbi:Rv1733c family protein [Mycobacterium sp. C3-094]